MFGSILISLLNCELQRFILYNNTIKHIIIFLSIFVFTFILDWYSPSSLVLSNKQINRINEINEINESYENNKNKQYNYIIESIKYTFLIYFLFILSSKQEKNFMYLFVILLFIIIILYIIYLINIDYYKINKNDLKTFFITKSNFYKILSSNKYNLSESLIYKLFILHNILSILYIILLFCLFIGFYLYALKQQKEKKNFNWMKFIFGINRCRNI